MSTEQTWKFSHIISIAMILAILAFGVLGAVAGGNSSLMSAASEQAAS